MANPMPAPQVNGRGQVQNRADCSWLGFGAPHTLRSNSGWMMTPSLTEPHDHRLHGIGHEDGWTRRSSPPLKKIVGNAQAVQHLAGGMHDEILDGFGHVIESGHRRKDHGPER